MKEKTKNNMEIEVYAEETEFNNDYIKLNIVFAISQKTIDENSFSLVVDEIKNILNEKYGVPLHIIDEAIKYDKYKFNFQHNTFGIKLIYTPYDKEKDEHLKTIEKQIKTMNLFFEGLEEFYSLGGMLNFILKPYPDLHKSLYEKHYINTFNKFKKVLAYDKYENEDYYDDLDKKE